MHAARIAHQAALAAGQVVDPADRAPPHRRRIEEQQVRELAGRDLAPVGDAVEPRRQAGDAADAVLQAEHALVAHPVAEQVQAVAGIAEVAEVGAGVGEADEARVVAQQALHRGLVGVQQGGVEGGAQPLVHGEVEHHVHRVAALAAGDGLDGLAFERPVRRRRRHRHLHPAPVAIEDLAALRLLQLVAEAVAEVLAADDREELLVRRRVQRLPGIEALEREGGPHREIHAERLARDLRPERVAPALRGRRAFQHADGALGEGLVVERRRHEHRPAGLGGQPLHPFVGHAGADGELEDAAAELAQARRPARSSRRRPRAGTASARRRRHSD